MAHVAKMQLPETDIEIINRAAARRGSADFHALLPVQRDRRFIAGKHVQERNPPAHHDSATDSAEQRQRRRTLQISLAGR